MSECARIAYCGEGRFVFWGPSLKLLLFLKRSVRLGVNLEPLLLKVTEWATRQPDHLVVVEVGRLRMIPAAVPCVAQHLLSAMGHLFVHTLEPAG